MVRGREQGGVRERDKKLRFGIGFEKEESVVGD